MKLYLTNNPPIYSSPRTRRHSRELLYKTFGLWLMKDSNMITGIENAKVLRKRI